MSKILVEVLVPAAGASFDVLMPFEAKLHEATELVKAVVADDVESTFIPTEDSVLCDARTGAIFSINLSAREIGLANGAKLMLL